MIAMLKAWWRRFRYVVELDGEPYLVRYRLIRTPWGGLYLHHILRSDKARHLHDHPFDFWTLIIWGSYEEFRPALREEGSTEVMRGSDPYRRSWLSLIRRRAEDLHRIELTRPCWTLFWRGPNRREWGFDTEEGWVDWKAYEAVKRTTS